MATSILQGLGGLGRDLGEGAQQVADQRRQEAQQRMDQARLQLSIREFQQRMKMENAAQLSGTFQTPDGSVFGVVRDPNTGAISTRSLYKSSTQYPDFRSVDDMVAWGIAHGDDALVKKATDYKKSLEKPVPDKYSAAKIVKAPGSSTGWAWDVMDETTGKSSLVLGAPNPYLSKVEAGGGGVDAYVEDLLAHRIKLSDVPSKVRGQVLEQIKGQGGLPPRTLNAQEQRELDAIKVVKPNITKLQDVITKAGALGQNSIADMVRARGQFMEYQAGKMPEGPRKDMIKAAAALQVMGAAPWVALGRGKYMYETIVQHLPKPTDTPALLNDKLNFLRGIMEDAESTMDQDTGIGDDTDEQIIKALGGK